MCPHCGKPECFQDRHHLYFPKGYYRTKLEKQFRGMFVEKVWRCQHDEIHARARANRRTPVKPPRDVMLVMMQRKRQHQ